GQAAAAYAERAEGLVRPGAIAGLGAEILEQAHVFDGDRGLVGEGLEQRDLLGGEGTDIEAANHDHAENRALANQRRDEDRPKSGGALEVVGFRVLTPRKLFEDVVDVQRATLDDRPARGRVA